MAVSEEDLSEDYIIPSVFNREVAPKVARSRGRGGQARGHRPLQRRDRHLLHGGGHLSFVKVLVTGASGFIGSALCDSLLARGDTVVGLTRDPKRARQHQPASRAGTPGSRPWNGLRPRPSRASTASSTCSARRSTSAGPTTPSSGSWRAAAPAPTTSSVRSPGLEHRPGVLVSQSAIGFYGDRGDAMVDESSRAGRGLRRRGRARVGEGGARGRRHRGAPRRSSAPATCSTRAAASSASCCRRSSWASAVRWPAARQYVSWIHVDDEVGILLWALDNEKVSGDDQLDRAQPGDQQGLFEGAWQCAGTACRDAGTRNRTGPDVRGRVRGCAQGRAAGLAEAGVGPRVRVQAS